MDNFELVTIPEETDKYRGLLESLIPQILRVIEKSGVSFDTAAKIPSLLDLAIKENTITANQKVRFTVCHPAYNPNTDPAAVNEA